MLCQHDHAWARAVMQNEHDVEEVQRLMIPKSLVLCTLRRGIYFSLLDIGMRYFSASSLPVDIQRT
jgi:hypothetical protein